MVLIFFVRGLLIGLSIAAVVGPISVLCIQRTLQKGQLYGLVSGMGAATADGIYGSIAGFGLTLISNFLVSEQLWIRLIGGLFLIYLGIKTMLTRPAERAATVTTVGTIGTIGTGSANNFVGAYLSTFLLTLTNPLTILSFAAIFAGIGVGGIGSGYLAATFVVLGVFAGSALWWLILTSVVSLLRRKMTTLWLLWVNRLSGAIILVFGILALISIA